MKSIVEAVFARMPGSVCKRDALLKWCGEKLESYVNLNVFTDIVNYIFDKSIGNFDNKFFKFMDRWYCIMFVITFIFTRSY